MKATRANLLGEFTGKVDGLIYYRSRKNGKIYVRRTWYKPDHPNYQPFAEANRNIFALQPSAGYKRNLQDYILQYNKLHLSDEHQLISWVNAYVRLMFAMQQTMPDTVDLKTIKREQIVSQNLPCHNVKAAIEAGLLPSVRFYNSFVEEL